VKVALHRNWNQAPRVQPYFGWELNEVWFGLFLTAPYTDAILDLAFFHTLTDRQFRCMEYVRTRVVPFVRRLRHTFAGKKP